MKIYHKKAFRSVVYLTLVAAFFQNCSNDGMTSITREQQVYLSSNLLLSSNGDFVTLEDTNLSAQIQIYKDPAKRITYEVTSQPKLGVLVSFDKSSGKFEYKPNQDVFGFDEFLIVAVVDAGNSSKSHSIGVEIKSVNDRPVARQPANIQTSEDTPVSGRIEGSDIESSSLVFAVTQNSLKGQLNLNADGSYVYTPNRDVNGSDSFAFTVSDGELVSNPVTVNISVSAVNDIPVAMDGQLNTNEDMSQNGRLVATDADNEALVYEIVTQPTKGSIQNLNSATGDYTFVPTANANGMDSFTFRVRDAVSASLVKTVTVNLNNVNDIPLAQDLNLTTAEDTAVNARLMATDVDNDALSYRVTVQPARGIIQNFNAATGDYTYLPNANQSGSDSFQYVARDGSADSLTRRVSINVTPVNDAPVANALSISTISGIAVPGTLTGADIEGSSLTYTVVSQPSSGAVSLNSSTGAFTYTPNVGFSGSDSFTFRVNDGQLNSGNAVVSVVVAPVTTRSITLAWDSNSETDLRDYKIYYGTNPSALSQVITNVPRSTGVSVEYTIPNLLVGTTYYFAVTAVNTQDLESAQSNMVSAP